MTSDSLPNPFVASATSEFNPAFHAFNGVLSSNTGWLGSGGGTDSLTIKVASAAVIVSYQIYYNDTTVNRGPKNWTLQGSNDGSSFTTIDTETNQTGWTAPSTRTFTVTGAAAYIYFRVNITANNGNATYTQIGQLYLFKNPPSVPSSGWTYYRTITVQAAEVPGNLSNFTVKFFGTYSFLATTAHGGELTNSSGYDAGFFSDKCVTPINWERPKYVATSGAVEYEFGPVSLSSSTNTVFYLCTGNSAVTSDLSNPHQSYDSNTASIWHFPDGSTLSMADTISGAVGTSSSAAATTGEVNGAVNTLTTLITAGVPIVATPPFTYKAWIKPADTSAYYAIYSTCVSGVEVRTNASTGTISLMRQQQATNFTSTATVTTGAWQSVSITLDASGNLAFYLNGSAQTATGVSTSYGSPCSISIGGGGDSNFTGALDEMEIDTAIRSSNWVVAQYNNESAPTSFYSVGAQQLVAGNSVSCGATGGSTASAGACAFSE